jgi:hypothetical protein
MSGGFKLTDELRQQISKVAKLMLVAGIVQIIPATLRLIRDGITTETMVVAAIAGFVPIFVIFAGVSLLGIAKRDEVDDVARLLSGFRKLHVAFMVKAVTLLLVLGFMVLGSLAMLFEIGR